MQPLPHRFCPQILDTPRAGHSVRWRTYGRTDCGRSRVMRERICRRQPQAGKGDAEPGRLESGSLAVETLRRSAALLGRQRLEARDDVEQLLVDAALAQAMEGPVEIFQQIVDVHFGALHRREAARILARQGFGAGPQHLARSLPRCNGGGVIEAARGAIRRACFTRSGSHTPSAAMPVHPCREQSPPLCRPVSTPPQDP